MAIAQMNWSKLRFSLEDKRMVEFADSLNQVYSLAESHPGFIWCITDNQSELQLSDFGFEKLISFSVKSFGEISGMPFSLTYFGVV